MSPCFVVALNKSKPYGQNQVDQDVLHTKHIQMMSIPREIEWCSGPNGKQLKIVGVQTVEQLRHVRGTKLMFLFAGTLY